MRSIFSVWLILSVCLSSFGQTIKITEKGSNKAIPDVFIYHENRDFFTYSDIKGLASLANFPTGNIIFQHPSYLQQILPYIKKNMEVVLSEKSISFNEVVVSANKWKQEEKAISQEVISIDKKTIDFQNPQTSADLLIANGQVFVQKSQLGGGSPKLRGFAANGVLLVVDGVRMNNAIFRGGNLQNVINIDPNAVVLTEVILGPGSIIYGSDALGGVMSFSIQEPKWSATERTVVATNFLTRYSSAANERTGHLDVSISRKRLATYHSFSGTIFSDLRSGTRRTKGYEKTFERHFYADRIDGRDVAIRNNDINLQRFSGYHLLNSIQKVRYRISDHLIASYGFYYSTTSDIPRYDNLTETLDASDSLKNAEWYYGPQKWMMNALKLETFKSTAFYNQARLSASFQIFEEQRNDRKFDSPLLRMRSEKVDMYTVSLDFDKDFNQSRLFYGLDFYHNYVVSTGVVLNIETGILETTSSRYPDSGSQFSSIALYTTFSKAFNDRLRLNFGARVNKVYMDANSQSNDAYVFNQNHFKIHNYGLNGSVALKYLKNEHLSVSFNSSTGFRSPNIDDIGKVFEVGTSIRVPNLDLKPEYSWSNDLVFQLNKDSRLLKASLFYSRLYNAIVEGPYQWLGNSTLNYNNELLNVVSRVNTSQAFIYGASVELQIQIVPHLVWKGNINITEGKEAETNQPLRHTTPVFGRSNLLFSPNKFACEAYVVFNGNRKVSEIPSVEFDNKRHLYTDEGSPGWYTLNFKSSYQLLHFLTIDFGIENILDKHYRPYTSGISAPGRSYILALRGTF